jgi:hypothetical protein
MLVELSTERSIDVNIDGIVTDSYWALVSDSDDNQVKI